MRETKQPARRKAAKDFFASSSLCALVTFSFFCGICVLFAEQRYCNPKSSGCQTSMIPPALQARLYDV